MKISNTSNSTQRFYIITVFIITISMALLTFTSCSSDATQNSESENNNTYTVTLNPQSGHIEEDEITLKKNEQIDKLDKPTWGKYEFKGWYTATRGGIKADLEDYNLPTDDSFTLYARWAPIEYYQFDDKWAKQKYSTEDQNDTVRGSGCGPGVMAIADATINNSDADIGTACQWSLKHDYFTPENGRTKDEFFQSYGEAHGLKVNQLFTGDLRETDEKQAKSIHDKAFKSVKSGNWIVAFMGEGKWTTGGHFVLWYDVDDNNDVYIRDTNSMKPYKAQNKFDVFKETVIRYWEIEVPDNRKVFST